MAASDTTKDLLRRYLVQQRELFGDELWVDRSTKAGESVGVEDEPAWKSDSWKNIESLESFHHAIQDCQKCLLGATRTNVVFGVGDPDANLVFIGEAPGHEEDLQGEPFVGRAGKLLDKILHAIELDRSEVYIANILKCRPPDNRDPQTGEIACCEPYLIHQIKLINPVLIVALGRVAGQTLLRTTEPLGALRGRIHDYNGIDLMVTYHPAALLRSDRFKRPTWEDMKQIKKHYLDKIRKK